LGVKAGHLPRAKLMHVWAFDFFFVSFPSASGVTLSQGPPTEPMAAVASTTADVPFNGKTLKTA